MQNGANGSDSLTSGEEKETEKTTVQPANPAGVEDRGQGPKGAWWSPRLGKVAQDRGYLTQDLMDGPGFASIPLRATVPILQQIPEGCLKFHVSSSIRVLMMAQTDKAPGSFFKSLTKEVPG